MNKKREVHEFNYTGFYIISLLLMAVAFVFQSPASIWRGMLTIIVSPSMLITDYMAIGGVGTAFFNSGLNLFVTLVTAQRAKARLTGALVAAVVTVAGFSFFGKNIVNMIPVPLGVYLYARFQKMELGHIMHVACFSTGVAPVVSVFMFGVGLPLHISIPLGILIGILVGVSIIPLSSSMLAFHQGYNLYNVGFTIGIIGLAVAGVGRMFGLPINSVRLIYTGPDEVIRYVFVLACSLMIGGGLFINGGFSGYKKLLKSSGRLVSDFVIEHNKGLVLINMGFVGLIALAFVRISHGSLNGPVIGGILTVIGFGAFGKHPRNIIPVFIGVYIAAALNMYDPSGTETMLIGLFGTTIAPIAGQFGIVAGILGGLLHVAIASNVGIVHGGLNLYNNGLAGGFVCGILVPIYQIVRERKEKRNERTD